MSRFLRPSLGAGFGYVPGEQPADGTAWVKLNTNESPLPPSPRVAAAVSAAASNLNRYPNPDAEPLRSALADHHRVEPSQVVVGNGADALINDCLRAFCEPGATVLLTEPTYSLLPVAAQLHGARTGQVELDGDRRVPAEFATMDAPLRFLVNPNTPTGTWWEPEQLAGDLEHTPGVLVIDEAYCDFAPSSCIPLLADRPSWVVLRTFSKSYALAGLRVGYAVGNAALIADLSAVGESYPVDRCAVAGALAALEDIDHHRRLVEQVVAERARISTALADRGWVVTPSHANFVCAVPPTGTAAEATAQLRDRRVLVRCFATPDRGSVRITVGNVAENDALIAALG
ncbi:MAG: histidinol-phosphate transaminase [Candidatus Dormibacteraeota bacterium]|uniref:Histidinol-phosphate aminotransferase n=1 Tax=Candidatus Aeolococcus gillhamiae TaxID=3127015 RepID=A0A2W5Z6K0_9BACT|nr:histidinol-phosphate transaminase [Candidatus Dormibacteraeota bacterium]PZR80942.1 MAG: histidinol-phosphate transaminase [Candidatus Dormibacter sp. RRmetagenome_bin12]